jgi:hypothetical protein
VTGEGLPAGSQLIEVHVTVAIGIVFVSVLPIVFEFIKHRRAA